MGELIGVVITWYLFIGGLGFVFFLAYGLVLGLLGIRNQVGKPHPTPYYKERPPGNPRPR